MAELTLKTLFELKGLNKKDIKGGKSTTTKTYISRAKREELERRKRIVEDYKKDLEEIKGLTVDYYIKNWGCSLEDAECNLKERMDTCIRCLKENQTLVSEMETAIQTGAIPDHAWCLWFAFDCEATKAYGAEAKRLFELLSDGKDHNIKGEIETGANQYEIISWEEF